MPLNASISGNDSNFLKKAASDSKFRHSVALMCEMAEQEKRTDKHTHRPSTMTLLCMCPEG